MVICILDSTMLVRAEHLSLLTCGAVSGNVVLTLELDIVEHVHLLLSCYNNLGVILRGETQTHDLTKPEYN